MIELAQELKSTNTIGRKATMAWAAFLMTNIWIGFDKLDQGAYIALMTLIFGIYATANVVGKQGTLRK